MSNFTSKPATRVGVVPLIDLYAESGCGKTYSGLLLARGLVGPTGKILGIDSENRRMSLYADVIPGGFDVVDLDAPFSPARYTEALLYAYSLNPGVILIDSASHEHDGVGGMLDMAGQIEEKSGKPGLHCWKVPKAEHAKFMQTLLRSPVPIICCLRAKYKSRQIKEGGRTQIVKDDYTSPIQSEDFIFEATVHMEIMQDHTIRVTKASHPALRQCFPEDGKGMITIEHGQKLAQWCQAAPAAPAGQSRAQLQGHTQNPLDMAKAELWKALKAIIGPAITVDLAQKYLYEKEILDAANVDHTLDKLNETQIRAVIEKLKS